MTRSRLIFAVSVACGCLLNWDAASSHSDETPALQTTFDRLLQSGPGSGGEGFVFEASPPDATLLPTNFLAAERQNGGQADGPLRRPITQQDEAPTLQVVVDRKSDDESPNDESTDEVDSAGDPASSRSRITARVERLRKPITEVTIQVDEPSRRVPANIAALYLPPEPMMMITSVDAIPPLPDRYTIAFEHRPLLYEQRNLERCGGSFGYLQNTVSGIQFVANTMVLPYRVCSQRAACPTPSGGDCQTCQTVPIDCNPFPVNRRGLISQAAAVAGFTFLLL